MSEEGVKYNCFHVTALCSPTRAAMLTGRNHHAVGYGSVGELSGPFPGYKAAKPQNCAPFPQILQMNGYSTAAFGKWHLTPDHQQGPAGPFDRWPNAWGFDYFWGFLGAESGQWDPLITENNKIIGVPEGENYYFPDDMANKTIEWLHGVRSQNHDKPWMLYFSTGCSHSPHHVPEDWAAKYKGKFDDGWDKYREMVFKKQKELGVIPADAKLTSRFDAMPSWDSLSDREKKLYARQMEVYAGYQENADWNVGRVIEAVEEMGELDNTLVIYIWGDNGASMEGTISGSFNEIIAVNQIPLTNEQQFELVEKYGGLEAWGSELTNPHYAAAWAWAGNCPFQWGKQVASHFGGTRNPLVIRWPERIKDKGGLRTQFTHVTDIGPTILDVIGLPEPSEVNGIKQDPMHGISFKETFEDANAPAMHTQQYFETFGNRAMYKDGWWACAKLSRIPWDVSPSTIAKFAPDVYNPDNDTWELYYLPEDFTQANNLVDKHPDKLEELKELFWEEAEKYNVLPLLAGFVSYFGILPPMINQTKFTYYGDVQNVASGMFPQIYNHSYSITAELEIPEDGVEGVIVAEADHLGGFALFVQDGLLKHTYSMLGVFIYKQESTEPIPKGDVIVKMEFNADAAQPATGGTMSLFINGKKVGEGRADHTVPWRFTFYSGMDISRNNGLPVDMSYADKSPFEFTGTVKKVVFDINPHSDGDEEKLHEFAHQGHVNRGIDA